MADQPEFIKQLKDGAAQTDGAVVTFAVEMQSGKEITLACATADIEKLVNWLVGLGFLAHRQRLEHGGAKAEASTTIDASPMLVQRIASAPGPERGDLVLGFDLGAVGLAFALPAQATRSLKAVIDRNIG